jgi:hypothetical protein
MNEEYLKELIRLTNEDKIFWEEEGVDIRYRARTNFYSTIIPGIDKIRIGLAADGFITYGEDGDEGYLGGSEIYPLVDALRKAIIKQKDQTKEADPVLQILRNM